MLVVWGCVERVYSGADGVYVADENGAITVAELEACEVTED